MRISIFIFSLSLSFTAAANNICVDALGQARTAMSRLGLFTESSAIEASLAKVVRYADLDVNVLITGETGSGKEAIANLLHSLNSSRASLPFVVLDGSAIHEETALSVLFGHMAGTFTGATKMQLGLVGEAQGGTLFIDEIAKLPLTIQGHLLRFLNKPASKRQFIRMGRAAPISANVRVVAATNQDLAALVKQGRFLPDLYQRLNVANIRIPPLRERVSEISGMALHLLQQFSRTYHKSMNSISPEAMPLLLRHSWPGNIRELSNLMERAVIDSDGSQVLARKDIEESIVSEPPAPAERPKQLLDYLKGNYDDGFQDRLVVLLMQEAYVKGGGTIRQAARLLDMPRTTFLSRWRTFQRLFPEMFEEKIFGLISLKEEDEADTEAMN